VISAAGDYLKQAQEARLVGQEVQQAKIDLRRRLYEEWLYERANTPTLQDQAEQAKALELRHALAGPALSEILSGRALNTLLQDLVRQSPGATAPATPLNQQLLERINVTPCGTSTVGVLKSVRDTGTLSWPLPLRGAAYEDETGELDDLADEAVSAVQDGDQPDADALGDMLEDVGVLRDKVSRNRDALTPSEEVQAKRFLGELEAALRALQQPHAAPALSGELAAEGRTVPELSRFMAANGLVFSPAVAGDEAAYQALYDALVAYRDALQGPGSRP
jgi:hypothetical protein